MYLHCMFETTRRTKHVPKMRWIKWNVAKEKNSGLSSGCMVSNHLEAPDHIDMGIVITYFQQLNLTLTSRIACKCVVFVSR